MNALRPWVLPDSLGFDEDYEFNDDQLMKLSFVHKLIEEKYPCTTKILFYYCKIKSNLIERLGKRSETHNKIRASFQLLESYLDIWNLNDKTNLLKEVYEFIGKPAWVSKVPLNANSLFSGNPIWGSLLFKGDEFIINKDTLIDIYFYKPLFHKFINKN